MVAAAQRQKRFLRHFIIVLANGNENLGLALFPFIQTMLVGYLDWRVVFRAGYPGLEAVIRACFLQDFISLHS